MTMDERQIIFTVGKVALYVAYVDNDKTTKDNIKVKRVQRLRVC
jgi:hypothetical protein